MTQSPFGSSAPPVGAEGSGADGFGATTVSGATRPASAGAAPSRNGSAPSTGNGFMPGADPRASGAVRTSKARGPRRARLQLRHISPLTVLKFSCVLSVALFFVWMIVIGVLYGVVDAAGVVGSINDTITTINGAGSSPPITTTIVFGGAAIVGVINIVLFIALTTIGAVIYNLCADLVGGIEITLSER